MVRYRFEIVQYVEAESVDEAQQKIIGLLAEAIAKRGIKGVAEIGSLYPVQKS